MGGETGIHPDVLMSLLKLTVLQTPLARLAPGRTEVGLLRCSLRPERTWCQPSHLMSRMDEPLLYVEMGEQSHSLHIPFTRSFSCLVSYH
jgi:hypothetical protein